MWQKMKNYYHVLQALAANIKHGFPGKKLIVIGVTGTDGKTTTVNLIYHMLRTAGLPASMISTVGADIHGKLSPLAFHVTNPSAFPLQKFLGEATKDHNGNRKNYLVLEVTSHGLDQKRIWGIPLEIGVVTNITHEHLDYHKTYNRYLRTKVKLLQMAKKIVVNKDDSSYEKILSYVPHKPVMTYGIKQSADITPETFPFTCSLVGEFNRYNVLAAVSVAKLLGIEESLIRKAIETFVTPDGRMHKIKNEKGIEVYIDYAHTANGIAVALEALRLQAQKKLIVLIGAEGYRDVKKRSIMGELAAKFADYTIITAVDPRGLISQINEQILEGAKKAGGIIGKNVFVENDRQKAIVFAIQTLAKKGDIVALFGKGHETSMNIDGKHELPWSDFKAVDLVLRQER